MGGRAVVLSTVKAQGEAKPFELALVASPTPRTGKPTSSRGATTASTYVGALARAFVVGDTRNVPSRIDPVGEVGPAGTHDVYLAGTGDGASYRVSSTTVTAFVAGAGTVFYGPMVTTATATPKAIDPDATATERVHITDAPLTSSMAKGVLTTVAHVSIPATITTTLRSCSPLVTNALVPATTNNANMENDADRLF